MSDLKWIDELPADEIPAVLTALAARLLNHPTNGTPEIQDQEDHLLNIDQASKRLGVSRDWLYRRAARLPFTRKLGPKMLRFSYQGIQKWLATRKPS